MAKGTTKVTAKGKRSGDRRAVQYAFKSSDDYHRFFTWYAKRLPHLHPIPLRRWPVFRLLIYESKSLFRKSTTCHPAICPYTAAPGSTRSFLTSGGTLALALALSGARARTGRAQTRFFVCTRASINYNGWVFVDRICRIRIGAFAEQRCQDPQARRAQVGRHREGFGRVAEISKGVARERMAASPGAFVRHAEALRIRWVASATSRRRGASSRETNGAHSKRRDLYI